MKKRLLGTTSRPLGSIWEIGLTAEDVYRRCRVYLRPDEKEPDGNVVYVDKKTEQEYMIVSGEKEYLQSGDNKPDATYIFLGKRGGRYVIDEEKIGPFLKEAALNNKLYNRYHGKDKD